MQYTPTPKMNTIQYELNVNLPPHLSGRASRGTTDPQWDEFRQVLQMLVEQVPLYKWSMFVVQGRAKNAGAIAQMFQRSQYPRADWVFSARKADDDTVYITRIPVNHKIGHKTVPQK